MDKDSASRIFSLVVLVMAWAMGVVLVMSLVSGCARVRAWDRSVTETSAWALTRSTLIESLPAEVLVACGLSNLNELPRPRVTYTENPIPKELGAPALGVYNTETKEITVSAKHYDMYVLIHEYHHALLHPLTAECQEHVAAYYAPRLVRAARERELYRRELEKLRLRRR